MNRLLLFAALLILPLKTLEARTEYSCFFSQDFNVKTGDVTNQVANNSLITIYLDGNKLILGDKRYSLYNKRMSYDGFVTTTHYDAIDNANQRCKVKFMVDSSADWATKNVIMIWYDEISDTAKMYFSREPVTR